MSGWVKPGSGRSSGSPATSPVGCRQNQCSARCGTPNTVSLTGMSEPLLDARAGLPPLDPAALGQALRETDRRYFQLGAIRRKVPGAEMVWIEGMADLPAAGVIHRVELAETVDPREWIDTVT